MDVRCLFLQLWTAWRHPDLFYILLQNCFLTKKFLSFQTDCRKDVIVSCPCFEWSLVQQRAFCRAKHSGPLTFLYKCWSGFVYEMFLSKTNIYHLKSTNWLSFMLYESFVQTFWHFMSQNVEFLHFLNVFAVEKLFCSRIFDIFLFFFEIQLANLGQDVNHKNLDFFGLLWKGKKNCLRCSYLFAFESCRIMRIYCCCQQYSSH